MHKTMVATATALVLALGAGGSVSAADQKYSTWTDPDAAQAATQSQQKLVDELRALVDEAEKARAADPAFLRDLKDLAAKYSRPWRQLLFRDDFDDGDFTSNPSWSVVSGRYWIEQGYGLRSAAPAPEQAPSSGGGDDGDVAKQIFGALLKQALRGKRDDGGQQAAATARPATIALPQPMTNAFLLRLEVTSWENEGVFRFGPYQGGDRVAGYRLVYRADATPALELQRVSARGTAVVDSYRQALDLEDEKPHVIEWGRRATGEMTVSVDGEELIRTTDRSFRDPFDGLVVTSEGGDFVVAQAEAWGQ